MSDADRRRIADPALEELKEQVSRLREEAMLASDEAKLASIGASKAAEEAKKAALATMEMLAPFTSLLNEISAAKQAMKWTIAVIASIGATITWWWNMKDHFHKGP